VTHTISQSDRPVLAFPGQSATIPCKVTSLAGFSSPVSLSCADRPTGVTCSLAPNQVTPPSNGNAASTLTLTISFLKAPGQYSVRVVGTSGSLVRSFLLPFQVESVEP
jgi:hypothetical protein